MTSPTTLLRDLLRTEHAMIARKFSEAQTEAQVSQVANDALTFASYLLLERDSDKGHHNFLGVPFWHFTSAGTCLDNRSEFTGKTIKLESGTSSADIKLTSLARDLEEHQAIILREILEKKQAQEASIVVLDVSLVTERQFLIFLFGFGLGRMPSKDDFTALKPALATNGDNKNEVLSKLCSIIFGSEEAASNGRRWQQL